MATSPEPYYIYATLKILPGKTEEALAGFKELAAQVEAKEPGCLLYQILHNEAEGEIIVFEIYKDRDAFQAHRDSEHFQLAMERAPEGLRAFVGPPRVQIIKLKGGFARV